MFICWKQEQTCLNSSKLVKTCLVLSFSSYLYLEFTLSHHIQLFFFQFSSLLKYGYVGKVVKGLSSDPRFPKKTRSDKLDNNSTTVQSVICGGGGSVAAAAGAHRH